MIQVEIERPSLEQQAEFNTGNGRPGLPLMLIKSWRDVKDSKGNDVEFNSDNLRLLAKCIPGMVQAIMNEATKEFFADNSEAAKN